MLETIEQPDVELEPEILDMKPAIADVIAELGLEIDKVAPRIVERLELLNRETKTIEDGERAIELAYLIFAHYEDVKPNEAFSDLEQKIVIVGSLFSDIGKTGPREANPEQQYLITLMFAVENVKDPTMTVQDFFHMYFPDTAGQKIQMFRDMALDPSMTMRAFWNLHSLWTLQIISGDGVPPEAIAGAAIHHIVDGVNPDNILGTNDKFTKYFGDNASFDRPEKLIIILDNFYAFTRRGGQTPAEAIEAIRRKIRDNKTFAHDQEFQTLLDDLRRVVSPEIKI